MKRYRFTQPTDQVLLAQNVLGSASAFSVACFVCGTDTIGGAFLSGWTDAPAGNRSWLLYFEAGTGKPKFVISQDGTASVIALGPTSILDGQLHHVCGTYSSGTLKLYVDGLLVKTTATTAAPIHTGGFVLAGRLTQSHAAFVGDLGRFRIWPFALAQTEITADANGQQPSGTLLQWDTDEGSGTTAIDSSGNDYHGTITGAAHFDDGETALITGEVIVVMGQSLALGRATNPQPYTGSQAVQCLDEAGNLRGIVDPSSIHASDIDGSGPYGVGSMRPLLATSITNKTGQDLTFIVNAKGGQAISQWGAFGGMWEALKAQLSHVETVKAIIWDQGQADASNGTSQASYQEAEADLVAAINAELGYAPPFFSALLGEHNGASQSAVDAINAAKLANIAAGITQPGPDVSTLDFADDLHPVTDAEQQAYAELWWAAIEGPLYGEPVDCAQCEAALSAAQATHEQTRQDVKALAESLGWSVT